MSWKGTHKVRGKVKGNLSVACLGCSNSKGGRKDVIPDHVPGLLDLPKRQTQKVLVRTSEGWEKGKGRWETEIGLAQDGSTCEGRNVITDRPTWWVLPDRED
jgi:hypothetical protein